jgi:CheY-like chemotaxis protein
VLILVAEDDADIRALVSDVLADAGHIVAAAPNGLAALDLAAAQPPDLILLDMQLPVMDGWEFAKRYREAPPPHAPIVVLTAAPDARRRAAEVGAAGFVGKPFDPQQLVALVERYAA